MGLFNRRSHEDTTINAKETTLRYLATLSTKEIDSIAATAKELHTINQKVKTVCYPQNNNFNGE